MVKKLVVFVTFFVCILSGVVGATEQEQQREKTLIQFTKEHAIYSYNSGQIVLFHPRQ